MKRSSRLSMALHVLTHMAAAPGSAITSEVMGQWGDANPVVMRRTFAGLRQAGLVASCKGHGGGWTLARAADQISLGEIYAALGQPSQTSPVVESPGCLVEQAVNAALAGAYCAADALLAEQLSRITLADLLRDVTALNPEKGLSHVPR